MPTWIALLRGINVGGRNTLRMKELVSLMESSGFANVSTYIQSGNVVFDADDDPALNGDAASVGERLSDAIEENRGFRPRVFILNADQLMKAIENNPYPEAADAPKSLHFFFLAEPATDPDLEKLRAAQADSERFELTNEVFYLHAPDGIGRSKLAANVERYLRVDTTARNWRTIEKLRKMVEGRKV